MLRRAARCVGGVVNGATGVSGALGSALRPALSIVLLEGAQAFGVEAQGRGVGFGATGEGQEEHGRDGKPHDRRRVN